MSEPERGYIADLMFCHAHKPWITVASSPGLPCFLFFYYTWKRKSAKNGEGLGTSIMWMTSGGREVDVGGALPINQLVCNSEFLTSEVEYCRSCETQESWLSLERSMMKPSTLFEHEPLPPYVHLVSTRRHSRDRCSQAFPVFRALALPCIILNENRRTKNGGALGTRLG